MNNWILEIDGPTVRQREVYNSHLLQKRKKVKELLGYLRREEAAKLIDLLTKARTRQEKDSCNEKESLL